MNRALVFGIAMFFAVVGIALLGGDNAAVAGHGCGGCGGGGQVSCDGGCGGGHGLFRGRKHRRGGLFGHKRGGGCCGEVQTCCGQPEPACCEQPACDTGCQSGCEQAAPAQECCQAAPPSCAGTPVYEDHGHHHGGGQPTPPQGDDVGPPPSAPHGDDAPPAPKEPSAKNIKERAPYVFRAASFRR